MFALLARHATWQRRCLLGVLVAGLGCVSALAARPAAALPSVITLPFRTGETWHLCQGYNGSISHGGAASLDLSLSPSSAGPTGCTPSTASASAGRPVLAPAGGTVRHVTPDLICLDFSAGGSMLIGHLASRPAANSSVVPGQQLGVVASPSSANGRYAHIHIEAYLGAGCRSADNVLFDDVHSAQLQCAPNLPYSGQVNQ
jgi:hypothetical protein